MLREIGVQPDENYANDRHRRQVIPPIRRTTRTAQHTALRIGGLIMATLYYDQDADLALLKGKKIAIIGYGSARGMQAQNLADSGCDVMVGRGRARQTRRPGGEGRAARVQPPQASREAGDLVISSLPDEVQKAILRQRRQARASPKPGNMLMCSHGFNIHFGQIVAARGRRRDAGRPQGPRPPVRSEFVKGGGVPCLIAIHQEPARTRKIWPRLRQGHRRHARRHHPDHLRRRDRDRPVRRASRPLRRRHALVKPGSKRSSKPATSPRWPTSSACTS